MFLFGNGRLCPLLLVPASTEISEEEESEVLGALKNSGVQCLCEQGICSCPPWKLSSSETPSQGKSRVSRGEMKAGVPGEVV